MERRANRHRWTEKDDIVALYFYKFGDLGRTSSLAIVGEGRGMGAGSLRMRVANFRAIAGGGRLDHAALQSRAIYRRYANLSESELRKLAGL
ncbi:MAG TPA: hypothetical protein VKB05_13765 [Pyrinomonadaceae bacterium]|jgi:hypothetical protein|nr:hypothetical protein [Pyrinomonadaceae bacterium]